MATQRNRPSLARAFKKIAAGFEELRHAATDRIKSGRWTEAHENDMRWILEELPELRKRIARWEKRAAVVALGRSARRA